MKFHFVVEKTQLDKKEYEVVLWNERIRKKEQQEERDASFPNHATHCVGRLRVHRNIWRT